MKRIFVLLFICFTASIATVVVLYAWSSKLRERPGSFLRQYPPHAALENASIKIRYNSYYLAGATNSHVYLGNTQAPLHVLRISTDLKDTVHITLKLPGIEYQRYRRIIVRIDSPFFYLMDGMIPYYYRGVMSNWIGNNVLIDSTYFIDALPLSKQSFIMRTTSAQTHEHVLGKKNLNRYSAYLNNTLLEKQVDGVFCTDGTLSYNRSLNKLIYCYYYRNQFIVMDTSLELDYRANTIDTVSHAQVRFATVDSEHAVRLAAPPPIINRMHTGYGKWLFNISGLPARNEGLEEFNKASVVDVYDLLTKQYYLSFYLYDKDKQKVKDFLLTDNAVFALYDHTLVRYDLKSKLFPRQNI